jgi:potassium-transporting ATPase potassium-binding subunit
MNFWGFTQIGLYVALVLTLVKPLGGYMERVFNRDWTPLDPVLRPVERLVYRACGIDPQREQHWTAYTVSMLVFSLAGVLFLYLLQRIQGVLTLNPQRMGAVPADLAFNTAVSFVTNTNWQAYSGETTMGYLVQMVGLTVQNFLSAATGIVLAIALVRGFARHSANSLGNFWADLTRCMLWILLPLSLVLALLLVWQGVP